MSERLTNLLDRIEADRRLDPQKLDLTIHDPALVRERFHPDFRFAQVTEGETRASGDVVRTILPNMSAVLDRFVDLWVPVELGHGDVLGAYMDQLEMPKHPARQRVTFPVKLAGRIAGVSPGFHDALELGYYIYFGLGEKETTLFYPALAERARGIDEVPLAENLTTLGKQEHGHLAFANASVKERLPYMRPWQIRVAEEFNTHLWRPVGTHASSRDADRRRDMGNIVSTISGEMEGGMDAFAKPVEDLAGSLLDAAGTELKVPVRRRYEALVREYKQAAGFV